MKHRKRAIRITIGTIVLAGAVVLLYAWPRPGPDSPSWWLARASNEAAETDDYRIHGLIVETYGALGDAHGARKTAHRYMDSGRESWLRKIIDTVLLKTGLKKKGAKRRRKPDSKIWSRLAEAQLNAGDLTGAMTSAAAIEGASDTRSDIFARIALAFADADDLKHFRECIENAKTAALASPRRNSIIAKQMCRSIAKTLAATGEQQQAQALVEALAEAGLKARYYFRIAKFLYEREDLRGFRHYLALAQSSTRSIKNQPSDRGPMVKAIAAALARAGDIDGALAFVESVKDLGIHPQLPLAIAEAGSIPKAMDLAKAIADPADRSKAYHYVAKLLAKKGDVAVAQNILDSLTTLHDGYCVNLHIAAACAKQGNTPAYQRHITTAIAVAHEISSTGSSLQAYYFIANECADNHDTANFQAVISKARAAADEIIVPRLLIRGDSKSRAYARIASSLARAGAFDQALATAEIMTDREAKTRTHRVIAKAYAEADCEAARFAAQALPAKFRPIFYRHSASSQAKTARLGDLKSWIETLEEPLDRAYAYLGAAKGLIEKQAASSSEE